MFLLQKCQHVKRRQAKPFRFVFQKTGIAHQPLTFILIERVKRMVQNNTRRQYTFATIKSDFDEPAVTGKEMIVI